MGWVSGETGEVGNGEERDAEKKRKGGDHSLACVLLLLDLASSHYVTISHCM